MAEALLVPELLGPEGGAMAGVVGCCPANAWSGAFEDQGDHHDLCRAPQAGASVMASCFAVPDCHGGDRVGDGRRARCKSEASGREGPVENCKGESARSSGDFKRIVPWCGDSLLPHWRGRRALKLCDRQTGAGSALTFLGALEKNSRKESVDDAGRAARAAWSPLLGIMAVPGRPLRLKSRWRPWHVIRKRRTGQLPQHCRHRPEDFKFSFASTYQCPNRG